MPTYDWRCIDCGQPHALFVPIKDRDEPSPCPRCESANTRRRMVYRVNLIKGSRPGPVPGEIQTPTAADRIPRQRTVTPVPGMIGIAAGPGGVHIGRGHIEGMEIGIQATGGGVITGADNLISDCTIGIDGDDGSQIYLPGTHII